MRIGLLSDVHDHIEHARCAVETLKAAKVKQVLHAGDYVNPDSVRILKGLKLIGVLGNNDGEKLGLLKAFTDIGGELRGEFAELELDGLTIALYHGTNAPIVEALAQCGTYDVVIYGHTHRLEERRVGKTLVVNPGTVHGFGKRATVAVLDTKTKAVEFIDL